MLSLCFRSLATAKGAPTVSSTAAATIRQAVAICFDHAVLPGAGSGGDSGSQAMSAPALAAGGSPAARAGSRASLDATLSAVASGRQRAALRLLNDLCVMCEGAGRSGAQGGGRVVPAGCVARPADGMPPSPPLPLCGATHRWHAPLPTAAAAAGAPPVWLKCPAMGRSFVLDLLEFVLAHRPVAFHSIPAFTWLLQQRVRRCRSRRMHGRADRFVPAFSNPLQSAADWWLPPGCYNSGYTEWLPAAGLPWQHCNTTLPGFQASNDAAACPWQHCNTTLPAFQASNDTAACPMLLRRLLSCAPVHRWCHCWS